MLKAGRATHTQLNSLRRQLGLGVDPAYDYSAMEEAIDSSFAIATTAPESDPTSHPNELGKLLAALLVDSVMWSLCFSRSPTSVVLSLVFVRKGSAWTSVVFNRTVAHH
eukprot:5683465-Amphidinium_carterae.1